MRYSNEPPIRRLIRRLQRRRQALGLSAYELEEIIGVTTGLVSKWESGIKNPSMFSLWCWCEAMGLVVDVRPVLAPSEIGTCDATQLNFPFSYPPPTDEHKHVRGRPVLTITRKCHEVLNNMNRKPEAVA